MSLPLISSLRELDLELEIAKNTLGSRQESLQLTNTLEQGGATSLLDVRQAEQLVETAAETIPDTERQIATYEDMLSTLMGENPHDIPRGLRADRTAAARRRFPRVCHRS